MYHPVNIDYGGWKFVPNKKLPAYFFLHALYVTLDAFCLVRISMYLLILPNEVIM